MIIFNGPTRLGCSSGLVSPFLWRAMTSQFIDLILLGRRFPHSRMGARVAMPDPWDAPLLRRIGSASQRQSWVGGWAIAPGVAPPCNEYHTLICVCYAMHEVLLNRYVFLLCYLFEFMAYGHINMIDFDIWILLLIFVVPWKFCFIVLYCVRFREELENLNVWLGLI